MDTSERNHSSSNTPKGLSKYLGVFLLAAVPGLVVGLLCGSLAKEAIEILRRPKEGETHLEKEWLVHVYSFCWNISMVICSFSVANAMSVLVYSIIPDDWSQQKKYSLAAPVGLLGLTIIGAVLGGIEGYIREISGNYFYFLIWSAVSFLLCIINIVILNDCVLCQDSLVLQIAIQVVPFASSSPIGLICFYFLNQTMPAVNPLSIILLIFILRFFALYGNLRISSSIIHLAPCIILMLPIAILSNFSLIQNNSLIVLTTHILAVGVGASIHLTLGTTEDLAKEYVGAITGGTAILAVVKNTSDWMDTWGSLGMLLGVSGAVGVALSAAGANAQMYGGWIEENCTEQGEKRDENGGKSDGQGQQRVECIHSIMPTLMVLLLDMVLTALAFLLELLMLLLFRKGKFVYWPTFNVASLVTCSLLWVIRNIIVLGLLDLIPIDAEVLTIHFRVLRLGMKEFITKWRKAARMTGKGGILGRSSVALGAATGVFLYTEGQDWRFRAVVAICAAVVPLTTYKTVKKPLIATQTSF